MNTPNSKIPFLPARIEGLDRIATNLSWCWSLPARSLFRSIDEQLWHSTRHNPVALLRRIEPARLAACAADPAFLEQYDALMAEWTRTDDPSVGWYPREFPTEAGTPVAYFCAEFGLHASVPIYSGGLGVLAGDHCKSASDLGVPLVGVGLMYRKGYFDQRIELDGWQQDQDEAFDVNLTPLVPVHAPDGSPCLASVRTFGRDVCVGAWKTMVGRVPLYLLDTNFEENHPDDRELVTKLYAGGVDLRLRQEWILGIGGVRVLRALGYQPGAWHSNEGHAAFMLVERLRELALAGVDHAEAVRQVRDRSIFTTHTPVPAGHDTFSPDQVEACVGPYWEDMGLSREAFLRLGQHPAEEEARFHMTVVAMRLSRSVNGVASLHGHASRRIWADLWGNRDPGSVPIGHITNGVHVGTWISHAIADLLDRHLGRGWRDDTPEPELIRRILEIPDVELWAVHQRLKSVLLTTIREEARHRWATQWKEATHVVGAGTLLDPGVLTIGFARRFATYKRANLMFHDRERLRRLLVNERRPVQVIFAGKAHPADQPGKEVLQEVYGFTRDPDFQGRVAFLEDYDMHVAHLLVQGVDMWLNLPRVPMEACGTSGMKAALNGVPQIGTLDGWWHEGFEGSNGWAIPLPGEDEDADTADVEHFYRLLEGEIIPAYYDHDDRGIPTLWVDRMRQAMRVAHERFTARRMVQDYVRDYYIPAMRGHAGADDPPLDASPAAEDGPAQG